GTDQGNDFARLDVEGDVVDRDHAAERLARMIDLEKDAGNGFFSGAWRQGECSIRPVAMRLERDVRYEPRPYAGRGQLQQGHQQDAEHDGLELAFGVKQIRQIALKNFLQDDDDRR